MRFAALPVTAILLFPSPASARGGGKKRAETILRKFLEVIP